MRELTEVHPDRFYIELTGSGKLLIELQMKMAIQVFLWL